MTKANQPRNRQRILPDERIKLDSAMVKRLKSWDEIPIRTTNRVLVDVDIELGRVIRNASKRENGFSHLSQPSGPQRLPAAFDLFAE